MRFLIAKFSPFLLSHETAFHSTLQVVLTEWSTLFVVKFVSPKTLQEVDHKLLALALTIYGEAALVGRNFSKTCCEVTWTASGHDQDVMNELIS